MGSKPFIPVIIVALLIIGFLYLPAQAQTTENAWSLPLNLSNSGAARSPSATIDSNDIIHVLWMDNVAGLQYSRFRNDQWSAPRNLELSMFRFTIPTLVSTESGYVHAFWISERNELLYTKVVAQYMGDFRSWYSTVRLDRDVVKFDVYVDSADTIHLAYVKVSDEGGSLAGIYYRRTTDEGVRWWKPVQLFASAYLRSVSIDDASIDVVSVSSETNKNVYVVWDNPFRKQVSFSGSVDGGLKFNPPIDIDKPDLSINSINPFHIRAGAQGASVVLVWQNGDPGGTCSQFFTVSNDAGVTWGERRPMVEAFPGCAQDNDFLPYHDRPLILQTVFQNQGYFIAFNGEQWSDPQFQPGISSYVDPVTINSVAFSCRNMLPSSGVRLYAVGCDAGGGNDIWVTSRIFGETDSWFHAPPIWSFPSSVYTSTVAINELTTAVDSQGRVHAFWSMEQAVAARRAVRQIFYTREENDVWSEAIPVLRSTDGKADQPSVTLDANNLLIVGWSGGQSGQIFFNSVDASRAFAINRWVSSVEIPVLKTTASSPQVISNENGTIYLSYLIPLNEDRGVYLTQSIDGGQTWGDPVRVFDAIEAGWDMVGSLSMTSTQNGVLHLIWTHDTLPGGLGPLELFYSRSVDGGNSWSEARLVATRAIAWSRILGTDEQTVHILWQEDTPGEPTLNHEYSTDGGIEWTTTSGISSSGDLTGAISIKADSQGNAHLLRVVRDTANNDLVLQHYQWQDGLWVAQENLSLGAGVDALFYGLACDISQDGRLIVLYETQKYDENIHQFIFSVYQTERKLRFSGDVKQVLPTLMPTVESSPTPSPTSPPPPSPTPQLVNPPDSNSSSPLAGASGSLVIGVGLAVVIVILAFGAGIIVRRSLP